MFTGIVECIGRILSVEEADSDWGPSLRLRIGEHTLKTSALAVGASVCVSGVCLTVESCDPDGTFAVCVSQASLSCIVKPELNQVVNLESALCLGDAISGHFVWGHVDCVGTIVDLSEVGDSHCLVVRVPRSFMESVAYKGSISINGVSLTINAFTDDTFTINLIPHTWQGTNFSSLSVGSQVNVELDMLARYVARYCQAHQLSQAVPQVVS